MVSVVRVRHEVALRVATVSNAKLSLSRCRRWGERNSNIAVHLRSRTTASDFLRPETCGVTLCSVHPEGEAWFAVAFIPMLASCDP